ncbi:PHD finger protein 12 [Caerostris extrusa]|uniref:PHD finger protein 12 n=1 Tax=Caerostris extrusa TaxID=172846 RepID=A0AAV4P9S9_CAEEX|nr:PHD finger protein 12 [Caerostris extrusa]
MGLSVDNDVCFSNYGHCNYLSSKHASIFYDEITKRCYELINYSSHGTVVDNIFYCFDTSDKRHNSSSTNSLSAQVRRLSRSSSRMNNLPSPIPSTQRHVVPSRGRQNFQPCKCRANPFYLSEGNGFENSALLNHGSFIQCGCLNFYIQHHRVRIQD